MEKQRVHVNGIDLAYDECGKMSSKAVILLHGFCGSSLYWRKICPLLSEQYYIIAPDLRGHGETSAPEGTYTMEVMADDIAALMEKLQIEKAVMFGHSLGGYVTAAFAERYPDKLDGYGLIHSTVLADDALTKEQRMEDIALIRSDGIESYITKLIPRLFSDAKQSEFQEEVEQLKQIGKRMKPESVIRTLEGMMLRPDRSDVLADARYPVLLIAGEEDEVVESYRTFTVNNKAKPEATYKYPHTLETTFEKVAHMSLLEVSEQLARVMATYLRTLEEKEQLRKDA